ncbi:MAG: GtrA family protein [bacterium]|nr:GtrA family protein [bacterium]
MPPLFKYAIVGASNTALDFVVYIALTRVVGFYFLAANLFSYALVMVWSFFWNKHWTFVNPSPLHRGQFLKFLLVNVVALLLSQGILFITVTQLYWFDLWGKALTISVGVFWSFTMHRLWTFRSLS